MLTPTLGYETITVSNANLTIRKTVNNSSPAQGEIITYTITVVNRGLDLTTKAFISDTLPAGLDFTGTVSLYPPGTGILGTPPLLANQLTIHPQSSISLTFLAAVDPNLPEGTVIVNTAAVAGADIIVPITGAARITVSRNYIFLPVILKDASN